MCLCVYDCVCQPKGVVRVELLLLVPDLIPHFSSYTAPSSRSFPCGWDDPRLGHCFPRRGKTGRVSSLGSEIPRWAPDQVDSPRWRAHDMDFGFLGVTSLLASLRLCMVKSVHTSVPLRKCLGRYSSDLRGLDCSWCKWGSLIDTGGGCVWGIWRMWLLGCVSACSSCFVLWASVPFSIKWGQQEVLQAGDVTETQLVEGSPSLGSDPQHDVCGAWWLTPVIPACGRWRWEDQKLKVTLGYIKFDASLLYVRPSLTRKKVPVRSLMIIKGNKVGKALITVFDLTKNVVTVVVLMLVKTQSCSPPTPHKRKGNWCPPGTQHSRLQV